MKKRCFNKKDKTYQRYGAVGITVCQGWERSFESFFLDMGKRPTPKHQIDRINNNLHYSCGKCDECYSNEWQMNCRWATAKEQARNRKTTRFLTYNDETMCIKDWAKKVGMKYETLIRRINTGWPIEKALTTPVRR